MPIESSKGQFGPLYDMLVESQTKDDNQKSSKPRVQIEPAIHRSGYTTNRSQLDTPRPIAQPDMFVPLDRPNTTIHFVSVDADRASKASTTPKTTSHPKIKKPMPPKKPQQNKKTQADSEISLCETTESTSTSETQPTGTTISEPVILVDPPVKPAISEESPLKTDNPSDLTETPPPSLFEKYPWLRRVERTTPSTVTDVFSLLPDKNARLVLKWSLGIGAKQMSSTTIGQFLGLSSDEVAETFSRSLRTIKEYTQDHHLYLPPEISSLLQA